MEELKPLVVRAQSGSVDAFSLLVHRFQDMAVGYAYTLLHDFHLAEDAAPDHARQLRWLRTQAAAYLREIADSLPAASRGPLGEAAGWYDVEVEALATLGDLCRQAADAGALTPALAQEAVKYLDKSLNVERKAIEQIEVVVSR